MLLFLSQFVVLRFKIPQIVTIRRAKLQSPPQQNAAAKTLRAVSVAALVFTTILASSFASAGKSATSANDPVNAKVNANAKRLSAAELEALADDFQTAIASQNVPAAALVIVQSGPPVGEPAGEKAIEGKAKVFVRAFGTANADTPFRLGSISKTFTALALLHAAAATQTPLSTPAATLTGDHLWTNRWHPDQRVTLGQLIELSAGFSDLSSAEFASAVPVERKTALATHRSSHSTYWPPGAFHSYSNLPPAFTALAVESLTDVSFENYLQTHVLAPLGLVNAGLSPLAALPGGFKADGVTPIPYWHTIYPAFGGLNATPAEFAQFLLALANNALPEQLAAAKKYRSAAPLYQPLTTAAARAGLTLGYGAGMYGWEYNNQLLFGHGGDADGYRSRYAVIPTAGRGYFFVINTDNPSLASSLKVKIEKKLTADLSRTNRPAAATGFTNQQLEQQLNQLLNQSSLEAQTFAGDYARASVRFGAEQLTPCSGKHAKLVVQADGILWRRGTSSLTLKPVKDGIYRKSNESLASVALVKLAGKPHVVGELGNWRRIENHADCTDKSTDF